MNQQEIRDFVESYFRAFQSPFLEETEAYFSVQLPIEVDKDLGNRPFYWTYVEKIGMEPTPLTLTFIFDQENVPDGIRGEALPFGSRRLHQIFDSAKKHGKYVRLYEIPVTQSFNHSLNSFPLVPWLGVNYKVEFICDQKKDLLLPLGMNLISGEIVTDFYQKLIHLSISPKLPDYAFTMQPIFGIDSAANRLEQYIQSVLNQEDTHWAERARERLEDEKSLIQSFYEEAIQPTSENEEELEEKKGKLEAEKQTRLQELTWQFEPRIDVSVINVGLFYLKSPLN